jgi:hypothetical protein
MFNVTVTKRGLFVVVDDTTGTVAVYVPTTSVLVVAVSVRIVGVAVPLRLVVSQPDAPAP